LSPDDLPEEFIDVNGGGPGVRLRKRQHKKRYCEDSGRTRMPGKGSAGQRRPSGQSSQVTRLEIAIIIGGSSFC